MEIWQISSDGLYTRSDWNIQLYVFEWPALEPDLIDRFHQNIFFQIRM
jgi:hypothetical protein